MKKFYAWIPWPEKENEGITAHAHKLGPKPQEEKAFLNQLMSGPCRKHCPVFIPHAPTDQEFQETVPSQGGNEPAGQQKALARWSSTVSPVQNSGTLQTQNCSSAPV